MRWVRWLALVFGLAGLLYLIAHLDSRTLATTLVDAGGGFAWMCALHVGAIAFDGMSIHACLDARERTRFAGVCIRAQLVGHSVNNLTPGRALGELLKLDILQRAGSQSATAAVTVAAATRGITNTILYGVIGIGVALIAPVPVSVARILGIAGGVTAFVGIAAGILASTRIPGNSVRRLLRILPARSRDRIEARFERFRIACGDVSGAQRLRSSMWALAASVLEIAEIYAVLSVLGAGSIVIVLAAAANGQIVRWVTALVPMSIGTAESGSYVLFRLLGANTTVGVALELLIKLRVLVFAALAGVLVIVTRAGGESQR